MRVLLDTHIVLSLLQRSLAKQYPNIASRLTDPATIGFVSVASLWETAIKTRLGKLDPGMPLEDIVGYIAAIGLSILPVNASHVINAADPEPPTRDAFDRLLLSQCSVEKLVLATIDPALVDHPLAMKM